jgi:hypothetical protein
VKKLRWFIAAQLDRSLRWCWADLVMWANYRENPLREARSQSMCFSDAARCGVCYCGKIRTQEVQDSGNFTGRGVIVERKS